MTLATPRELGGLLVDVLCLLPSYLERGEDKTRQLKLVQASWSVQTSRATDWYTSRGRSFPLGIGQKDTALKENEYTVLQCLSNV